MKNQQIFYQHFFCVKFLKIMITFFTWIISFLGHFGLMRAKEKQQKIKKVNAFSTEVPLTFLIFIFDMTLTHFHLTLS